MNDIQYIYNVCASICLYLFVCIYLFVSICLFVCTYVCTGMYACVCIYLYIYIYIYSVCVYIHMRHVVFTQVSCITRMYVVAMLIIKHDLE